MQFNVADVGLCQDVDWRVDTNTTTYPLADKARRMNRHYDRVVSLILSVDGRWQWDDANTPDLPIGLIDLQEGVDNYAVISEKILRLNRVEVLDKNGNWNLVKPIDEKDLRGRSLSDFQKTNGLPKFYDKIGESIFLYPAPSSSATTLTQGLKIYYQRIPEYFLATDTTKEPGFAQIFHEILSIGAALDYAKKYNKTLVSGLEREYNEMMREIKKYYSERSRDERSSLTPERESYGEEILFAQNPERGFNIP